jgi:hypothetical protein
MKEGFIYIYSDYLGQEIALSEKTGILYCADKTQYSPAELELLDNGFGPVPLSVHRVKKFFHGEVIKFKMEKDG